MKQFQFHNDYKVSYQSEEIQLLPKEFQLLKFLYQHSSRIFTRDELLDSIWSMEAPTDRTVDDHIYRLRKKLKRWISYVEIETVRGQGYRLTVKKERNENPLLQDKEVSLNVKALFQKYHRYGQGNALNVLELNQSVFGFQLDERNQMYLRFMKGDFNWFVETTEVSFWDRCYYLLHLYSYVQKDKSKCLRYFETAMQKDQLPEHDRMEIELLNRSNLLIFTKQLIEAEKVIVSSKKIIYEENIEGYIPLLALTELYLSLFNGNISVIEEQMLETEKIFEKFPYLREQASFFIIRGIYLLFLKKEEDAMKNINKGFELFQESKFIPGILVNINLILFFLEEFFSSHELLNHFEKMYAKYAKEYQFNKLEQKIDGLFNLYL